MAKGAASTNKGGRNLGTQKGKGSSAKGKKGPSSDGTEAYLNDLDNFESARGKIQLATHEADSDIESDDEHAVFNVGTADDSDDDEDNDDDEEEDDDEDEDEDDEELDLETERALRKLKMRKPFVDEDGILEEKKKKEISEKAWGKKKSSYYQDDEEEDEEEDEDDELKGEEDEARRVQKEKYSAMHDEDFGGDDLEDSFQSRIQKKAPAKATKEKTKKGSLVAEKAGIATEKIDRDVSALSQEELTEIISNESPELLQLLAEFKEKIAEVKNNLQPILERVRKGELPMTKGISFLEMKYHVMLSYCTNISFYLLLKATGGKVKDHPVINQLVELRTVMEKIKPLEQKLQYQIDKLVRTANTGTVSKDDPLRFKPNPESMLKGSMGESGSEDEKDEVYQPTKIAPVLYEEPKDKLRKQQDRLKQKASRSRLLKDLQEEFSELPETHVYREELDEYDRRQQEKLQHEEEYFVRLPVTKEDKKKSKKRFDNELANFDDFGDLAALEKTEITTGQQASNKKRKAAEMDRAAEKDASILDALNDVANDFGEGADLDDSYYQEVKSANKKAKKQKKAEKAAAAAAENAAAFEEGEAEEEGDGKRMLTKSMLKNRGLTAHKKKELKNPRVKRRVKYEQAKKKLNSIVRPMADKSKPYQGEKTGIKSNLARSVKIK